MALKWLKKQTHGNVLAVKPKKVKKIQKKFEIFKNFLKKLLTFKLALCYYTHADPNGRG